MACEQCAGGGEGSQWPDGEECAWRGKGGLAGTGLKEEFASLGISGQAAPTDLAARRQATFSPADGVDQPQSRKVLWPQPRLGSTHADPVHHDGGARDGGQGGGVTQDLACGHAWTGLRSIDPQGGQGGAGH